MSCNFRDVSQSRPKSCESVGRGEGKREKGEEKSEKNDLGCLTQNLGSWPIY